MPAKTPRHSGRGRLSVELRAKFEQLLLTWPLRQAQGQLDLRRVEGPITLERQVSEFENGTHYEDRKELLDMILGILQQRAGGVDFTALYEALAATRRDATSWAFSQRLRDWERDGLEDFAAVMGRLRKGAKRSAYCQVLANVIENAVEHDPLLQALARSNPLFAGILAGQSPSLRRERRGPADRPFLKKGREEIARAGVPAEYHSDLLRAIGLLPWRQE